MHHKRKIYFRADAGPEIGYGHYIRSLALADMLKQDFDCTMFTQTPTDYQLRECESVCSIVVLPNDESKFEKFLEYLNGDEIVVLDNYFFTTDYQCQIKAKGCKLVCIDDMHDRHYVADIVINHAPGLSCEDFVVESYTQLCLGMDWSLLRKPFLKLKQAEQRNGCFVCMGGADFCGLSEILVDAILDSTEDDIHLIVGDINPRASHIHTKYADNTRVHLYSSLSAPQMAELMRNTMYGIVPSSGLLWESQACQLPVLYGYYVDNQQDICERNKSIGVSRSIGDMRLLDLEQWKNTIRQFRSSVETLSVKFKDSNIQSNFRHLFAQRVTIRPSRPEDCDIYFEWANDPNVRAMAYTKNAIAYEDHVRWYSRKMKSHDSYLYICYANNEPIGQVRYDIEDGTAHIDISVDNKYRGKALGKEILSSTLMEFHRQQPQIRILAEVLSCNLPSQKMFEACKFKQVEEDNIRKVYEFCNCI